VTTWPSPEEIRRGSSARVRRRVARTFISHIQRQSSSEVCSTGSSPFAPPALFTSTRAAPTPPAKAAIEPASRTSSGSAVPPISSAISVSSSIRRAPSTTWKPAAARARAVAAPIPALAPVTTAVGRSSLMTAD